MTVEVKNKAELKVIGNAAFTPPGEEVTLQATFPACDNGKVELKGITEQDFELEEESQQCSLVLLEKPSGGNVSTETGTWNGICNDARAVSIWTADLFVDEQIEDTQNLECLTCGENSPLLNPEDTKSLVDDITSQGSPTFNDLKSYDNAIQQVNKLSGLLQDEGVSVPGIGGAFQTQSVVDNSTLSNRAQRFYEKYLTAFESYETYKNHLSAEASVFSQTYSETLQSQALIDDMAIEEQYHPEDMDAYRDEILERLLAIKENLTPNTHSLVTATQSYAELVQLYLYLSQDHFEDKFVDIDLANSEWEPYDPSLEDKPEVIALEKIRNSSHLMRFTHRKVVKMREKLTAQQKKLEDKLSPFFDALDISPESYTQEYYSQLLDQYNRALSDAEQGFVDFETVLNADGFSTQSSADGVKRRIQQKVDNVKDSVKALAESSYNSASKKYDNLKKQIQSTRDYIREHAPGYLNDYDAFISPLENQFKFIPSVKLSSAAREFMIQCLREGAGPQKGDPEGPLIGTGKYKSRKICNVQQIDINASCPGHVWGYGRGSTQHKASVNAEKSANKVIPRGCYKRHCHDK